MCIRKMKTNKIEHKNKFDISAITSYDFIQNKSKTRSRTIYDAPFKSHNRNEKISRNEKFKFISNFFEEILDVNYYL